MSESVKKKQQANANLDAKQKIESPWTIAFRRLKKNKLAMVSLFILCVLVLSAILADVITPYGRDQINLADKEVRGKVMELPIKKEAPDSNFILGTDELGRDIFYAFNIWRSYLLNSWFSGCVFYRWVIGIAVGSIAGFYGGIVDAILMRLTDIIMCFPFLVNCHYSGCHFRTKYFQCYARYWIIRMDRNRKDCSWSNIILKRTGVYGSC